MSGITVQISETKYNYTENGKIKRIVHPNDGHITRYLYDEFDRVRKITNSENIDVLYQYDDNSNVTDIRVKGSGGPGASANILLSHTKHSYDEKDRKYKTTLKNKNTSRDDSLGNLYASFENNPGIYTDPSGLVLNHIVGGIIGGAFEFGYQTLFADEYNGTNIGIAAVAGAASSGYSVWAMGGTKLASLGALKQLSGKTLAKLALGNAAISITEDFARSIFNENEEFSLADAAIMFPIYTTIGLVSEPLADKIGKRVGKFFTKPGTKPNFQPISPRDPDFIGPKRVGLLDNDFMIEAVTNSTTPHGRRALEIIENLDEIYITPNQLREFTRFNSIKSNRYKRHYNFLREHNIKVYNTGEVSQMPVFRGIFDTLKFPKKDLKRNGVIVKKYKKHALGRGDAAFVATMNQLRINGYTFDKSIKKFIDKTLSKKSYIHQMGDDFIRPTFIDR